MRMSHHWHTEDNSLSNAVALPDGPSDEPLCGSEDVSCMAEQIRELLGKDYELSASLFEEYWVSGQPIAARVSRRRANEANKTDATVSFAELNNFGNFSFPMLTTVPTHRSNRGYQVWAANWYGAEWVDRLEEHFAPQTPDEFPMWDSSSFKDYVSDPWTFDTMTPQQARKLLGVTSCSTRTEIRSAYRELVGKWHPDRFERNCASVREIGTRQTAALNEAYRLLRSQHSTS